MVCVSEEWGDKHNCYFSNTCSCRPVDLIIHFKWCCTELVLKCKFLCVYISLLLPGRTQLTARSQIAASLGWMSMKGLRHTPMKTPSWIWSSGTYSLFTMCSTSCRVLCKIHSYSSYVKKICCCCYNLCCEQPDPTESSPDRWSRFFSPPCWTPSGCRCPHFSSCGTRSQNTEDSHQSYVSSRCR